MVVIGSVAVVGDSAIVRGSIGIDFGLLFLVQQLLSVCRKYSSSPINYFIGAMEIMLILTVTLYKSCNHGCEGDTRYDISM